MSRFRVERRIEQDLVARNFGFLALRQHHEVLIRCELKQLVRLQREQSLAGLDDCLQRLLLLARTPFENHTREQPADFIDDPKNIIATGSEHEEQGNSACGGSHFTHDTQNCQPSFAAGCEPEPAQGRGGKPTALRVYINRVREINVTKAGYPIVSRAREPWQYIDALGRGRRGGRAGGG